MKHALLIVLICSFPFAAMAQTFMGPCSPNAPQPDFDMRNSDDLLFAGLDLIKSGQNLEGIECLNLGKTIAPSYLDIRLGLIDGFAQLNDRDSALREMRAFDIDESLEDFSDDAQAYYRETYAAYVAKVNRITQPVQPNPRAKYIDVALTVSHSVYHSLLGEKIVNEAKLKDAVELKFRGEMDEARAEVLEVLNLCQNGFFPNRGSPTVWFFLGLIDYDMAHPTDASIELAKALTLANHDLDVVLSLARALNSDSRILNHYGITLHILSEDAHYFSSYGCLQYAQAAHQAIASVDAGVAAMLQDNILRDMQMHLPSENLCIDAKSALAAIHL